MTARAVDMRSPDGWRVSMVTLVVTGRRERRLQITSPRGIRIGYYASPDDALAELRRRGVDPATLVDYIGTT